MLRHFFASKICNLSSPITDTLYRSSYIRGHWSSLMSKYKLDSLKNVTNYALILRTKFQNKHHNSNQKNKPFFHGGRLNTHYA